MTLTITSKGFIRLLKDGVEVSQHSQETKAIESAVNNGDGTYRIVYPEKEVRVVGTLNPQTLDTTAPTQPPNLVATAIHRTRVDLAWAASTDDIGVTGYQILRDGAPLATTTVTSYSDTTVTSSTTYSYTVVAFDAAGNNSIPSAAAPATTPANSRPSWDTIPDQVLIVGDSFSLDLNDFCADSDDDTLAFTATPLPSGLTRSGSIISGTPTTAGEEVTADVTADDTFDTAATTINFETFDADATAPPVPTGLTVTALSPSQIGVNWNASTDVAGSANEFVSGTQDYRLYRSTDGTNFSLRLTTTSTIHTDTDLAGNTTYQYKVAARDAELNESAQSTAQQATTTGSAGEMDDWLFRISGAGVVWYHDFETASEVNQFRWTGGYGNDPTDTGPEPNTARWRSDDGITHGCLEIWRAPGFDDPSDWWRPFSPLNAASNGRGVDDPAANGTLTLRSFTPVPDANSTQAFQTGYYGHTNYHGTGQFDGTEYYLQCRVKMDPNRIAGSNQDGGKLFFLGSTVRSNMEQTVVVVSGWQRNDFNGVERNFYRMYREPTGNTLVEVDSSPSVNGYQPGSEYGDGICNYLNSSNPLINNCWYWPLGEWVTLLYHVKPGLISNSDTLIEVWAARAGETSYTKIWSQSNVDLNYQNIFGHNSVIASAYMNGAQGVIIDTGFYHRYCQMIFSKQFIPCPDGTASSWVSTAIANGWTVGTWARISDSNPSHGLSATNRIRDVKTVDPSTGELDGITNNWCGGAFAPDMGDYGTYIVGLGGGHTGYPGNDVFGFDVKTRTWTELWPDTSTTTLDSFGEWDDGSPSGLHTYFQLAATPALTGFPSGIFLSPKSVSSTEGQTPDVATPYPHYLDLANPQNGWTRLDALPDHATRASWRQAAAGIWDSTRNRYWLWALAGGGQTATMFASLNPLGASGSQWVQQRPTNSGGGHGWFGNGIEQVLFHDTVRDIIITLDYRSLDVAKYLFPGSPATYRSNSDTGFPITESGTPPSKTEGGGVDWSTIENCAYWWGGSATAAVYRFKYSSGSVGSQGVAGNITYAWTNVLSGSNTITPASQGANDQKVYNRFRIVRVGDVEFAIALTHVDGPVYAFRLS